MPKYVAHAYFLVDATDEVNSRDILDLVLSNASDQFPSLVEYAGVGDEDDFEEVDGE